MPFAAALSEHPDTATATGEVIGHLLERVGPRPDLAALFVTTAHTDEIDQVVATIRKALAPSTLVGTTAASVIGGTREVEDRPGVALWAASCGPCVPVRLETLPTADGPVIVGLPARELAGDRALLLLADPFSFPVDGFLEQTAREFPGLTIIGGLASAARSPGGNRLVIDDQVTADGAVGVLLPPSIRLSTVVSQGCRPIGEPLVVTRAEGNLLYELAGQPALQRVEQLVENLSPDDRALARRGLHMGVVIDERRDEFRRGDFLVRSLMGADRTSGAVAVGEEPRVGSVVQFQVRDADSADEDLRHLLGGERADAALVFTCNGRGVHLFGAPDHDARVVGELLDDPPAAGMFCAGEIGPIGGRNFLHGFTASVALFHDPSPAPPSAG